MQGVRILRDLLNLSQVELRMSLRFLGIHSHSPVDSQVGIGNENFSDASVGYGIPQCGHRHTTQADPDCGTSVVPVAQTFQDLRKRWLVTVNLFATSLFG